MKGFALDMVTVGLQLFELQKANAAVPLLGIEYPSKETVTAEPYIPQEKRVGLENEKVPSMYGKLSLNITLSFGPAWFSNLKTSIAADAEVAEIPIAVVKAAARN